MVILCLISWFGAALLFGAWKKRPQWVNIVTWAFICLTAICSLWLLWYRQELRATVEEMVDNVVDFTDCFDAWLDNADKQDYKSASFIMTKCSTQLIEDTTATYKAYLNYNK